MGWHTDAVGQGGIRTGWHQDGVTWGQGDTGTGEHWDGAAQGRGALGWSGSRTWWHWDTMGQGGTRMSWHWDGVAKGQGDITVTQGLEGTGMGQHVNGVACGQGGTGMQWDRVTLGWDDTGSKWHQDGWHRARWGQDSMGTGCHRDRVTRNPVAQGTRLQGGAAGWGGTWVAWAHGGMGRGVAWG